MAGELRLTLAEPTPAVSAPPVRNLALYDGGSHTRRTVGWRAPTSSPNDGVLAHLTTLRDRSRAAARNDGYGKGVLDKLVANVIGTGIQPLSQAADPELRKRIDALFLRWTDESDADGQLDWYGQQTQAVRGWFEGGEVFVRLRPRLPEDGLSVPLQVQVLEPELCPHTHHVLTAKTRIRAGIEFNAIGRRVAYWFHPSRPELDDYDRSELRRVPADSVCHVYDPLRPGQLRGLPHLTQSLIELHELDKFTDATLLRQQLANLFVAFLTRPPNVGDAEAVHPLTGELVSQSPDDKPMLTLEAGIFQELFPGEDVKFSDPPEATGFAEFVRQILFAVAAATGVPYEVLTGDMRGVNDRTVRLVLNEFRRRIQAWQHQIVVFQLCRRVWNAWFDRVFLSGALPIPADYLIDPEPWRAVRWSPQGWPYMHPVQDVEAEKEAVRSGFKSRSAVVSERGEDAAAIDAEQAADNERADSLGLRYDSDGRTTEGASSQTAGSPDPARDPESVPQPDGTSN